jgi:hypothetical protein
MQITFSDLVNYVRNLSLPEKLEIKDIVEKSIIEEQRNEIHECYLKSKKEYKENKLKFSDNIDQLRKMID